MNTGRGHISHSTSTMPPGQRQAPPPPPYADEPPLRGCAGLLLGAMIGVSIWSFLFYTFLRLLNP